MEQEIKYKVIGVSSGMGVSLFPFKKHVIANIEARAIFHTPRDIQWKLNFGDIPLFKKNTPLNQIKLEGVDVLISSPDCGSGSVLRYSRSKKLGDHTKNLSLLLFLKSVRKFNPKFFEFENLLSMWKSFPKERFLKITKKYRILEYYSTVSRWGNSQISRKRMVIIGIRKDLPKEIDRFFKLPNYGDEVKPCRELYGDLKEENLKIGHVRENGDEFTTIYAGRKITNKEITHIWNTTLKDKRRWTDCPDKKFTTAPGVYRNRDKDYPSTARKANRQFDDSGLMLTPRQLARIQGVPDNFLFHMDKNNIKYCINKCRALVTKTPPFEISNWFKKRLEKCYMLWKNIN